VPWLRRLAAGLPIRIPGFDPGSAHVGLVMDEVAVRQVFPEYFGLPLLIYFHRLPITRKRTTTIATMTKMATTRTTVGILMTKM
jgi:hypothetical protein